MITEAALNQLPGDVRLDVENALRTLARSQILLITARALQQPILDRMDEAKEEDLAKEIVKLRGNTRVLRGLHDLGTKLHKGITDGNDSSCNSRWRRSGVWLDSGSGRK